jgi:thioesterase domain-containing protein
MLATLRDRDTQVWADGDQLRCNAPTGTLTPELRDELRQRKSEILSFLQSAGSLARQQRAIVPLQPRGTRPPIFAFGGHNGDVFCFRALAHHLGEDQPFFGLQPPGFDGHGEPLARVEDLAAYFAAEIREFQPSNPYIIAGFCAGGSIAFELARQRLRAGTALSSLALIGAPYPTAYRRLPRLRKHLVAHVESLVKHARTLASLPSGDKRSYIAEKLHIRKMHLANERPAAPDPVLAQRDRVAGATFAALRRYVPSHFPGRLSHFLPCEEWVRSRDEPLRWRSVARHVEEYFGPSGCSTDVMLLEPYASGFAALFRQSRARSAKEEWGRVDENSLEFA